MSFSSLQDFIPKIAAKYGLASESIAALVIARAQGFLQAAFPNDIDHIKAARFAQGVLWIATGNAVLSQEVQLKAHLLLQDLNQQFQEQKVKKVRIYQEIC